jgi:hypothetical protein
MNCFAEVVRKGGYPKQTATYKSQCIQSIAIPFQSLISMFDILFPFLQNEFIMALYRTLSLIASQEIRIENGYVEPSVNGRKARLAPAYALPMVDSRVSRNNLRLRKPAMAGNCVFGHRAGSRTAQDSRLDEALRNSRWGKARRETSDSTDRKSGGVWEWEVILNSQTPNIGRKIRVSQVRGRKVVLRMGGGGRSSVVLVLVLVLCFAQAGRPPQFIAG